MDIKIEREEKKKNTFELGDIVIIEERGIYIAMKVPSDDCYLYTLASFNGTNRWSVKRSMGELVNSVKEDEHIRSYEVLKQSEFELVLRKKEGM